MVIPQAFSTALTEHCAWTVVQTPHIREVSAQHSLGSLPFTMVSMPLHMVPDDQASVTLPPSTWASILKCPSILVTGSIAILAMLTPPLVVYFSSSLCGLPFVALITAWAATPAAATAATPRPILSALV